MPAQQTEIQNKIGTISDKVVQVQERLRLKSKLFSMEARDAFESASELMVRLRHQLQELESGAAGLKGEISLKSHLGLMEAEKQLGTIRQQLKENNKEGDSEVTKTLDRLLEGVESMLVKFRN